MQQTDTPPKDSVDHLLAVMPKAELHLHLDGSVRLETIAELAARENLPLPIPLDRLAELCVAPDRCRDLIEMLSYFALPIQVMQTPDSLERVTYELCEDLRRENVRYAEIILSAGMALWKEQDLAAVYDAVRKESRASAVQTLWIFDSTRQFGVAAARRVGAMAAERVGDGGGAVGLGGDAVRGAAELWERVFRRAPYRSAVGMDLAIVFCVAGQRDVARSYVQRVLEFESGELGVGCRRT